MSEIDSRITPALHPDTIKGLDGWSEETKGYVAGVETAFSEAYESIRSIWTAKEAGTRNPTLTPEAKLIQIDDFATKKVDRLTRLFDSTRTKLEQGIIYLEGELSVPVKEQAGSTVSAEIRAHVKAMDTAQRQTFIQEAIDAGDAETVSAILGAKHYLTGMTAEMQSVLLRQWHAKQQPEKAARLKVMLAAKEKIERDAGKVFTAAAEAVGYLTEPNSKRRIYAAELRKAKVAAERPFAS